MMYEIKIKFQGRFISKVHLLPVLSSYLTDNKIKVSTYLLRNTTNDIIFIIIGLCSTFTNQTSNRSVGCTAITATK